MFVNIGVNSRIILMKLRKVLCMCSHSEGGWPGRGKEEIGNRSDDIFFNVPEQSLIVSVVV